MKALIIYDSGYGNTERIAKAIAVASGGKAVRPAAVNPAELQNVEMLIIGSPTQGGRATLAIQELLAKMPEPALNGMAAAAFDTRLSTKLVGIFGFAAAKIAESLKKKGCNVVVPPQGFFVKGKGGPLKDGELERATRWAERVKAAYGTPIPV